MSFGQHELWASWRRYLVCQSYEAAQYGGRVLSGSEAESVIAELLRDRDEQQVRTLYADLTGSFDLRRVSNDEVRRWFSRKLADGAHDSRVTGLVLLEVPMLGRLGHRHEPASARGGASSEAERLLRAMEAAQGEGDVVHAGESFRLVVVSRAGLMPRRDRYEALGSVEAQGLLQAMATDARLSESVRPLLVKAAALMATGQSANPRDRLLLLRRYRSTGPVAERAEPPMTPAQFAKALEPKERAYIIVEIYSDEGTSMPGVALKLTAPNGTVSRASTDENGETGLWDLDPASYSVTLA